jgi:BirA family biotin operon repressor/biotin-[acetyl-CoA-carboxylase] ligase
LIRLIARPHPVNLVWFDTVDSTNAVAERFVETLLAGEDDRPAETVVVARRQLQGKGRAGHVWESPPGGVYATWVAWVPARSLPSIPMVVGVSVAEAVEEVAPGVRVDLKWPNDLQVGGRKLGGVLCTSRTDGEAACVVAGFGLNVEAVPTLAPHNTAAPVSLRSLGLRADAQDAVWSLVAEFLERVHQALEDRQGTRARWVARSVHRVGDAVRLRVGARLVEGNLVGFGGNGELELDVGGETRRFSAGELVTLEQGG